MDTERELADVLYVQIYLRLKTVNPYAKYDSAFMHPAPPEVPDSPPAPRGYIDMSE